MTVDNVPAVQIEKEWYQFARIDEENITAPPISHGYQTQASILQSKETDSLSTPGVRQIDTLNSEPTGEQLVFGISSPTPKELPRKISAQSNMGIDHHDHANSPGMHQLAGVGVPEFQTIQNQCQTIHIVQEIVSMPKNQILHGPNVSNIKNSASKHYSDGSVRRNANVSSAPIQLPPLIGNVPLTYKDASCQNSLQSSEGIACSEILKAPFTPQLIESDAANSQMVPAQLESISGSPTATSNIPTLPNHHPTATATLQQNSGIQGINKSAAIPVGNQGHVAHPKAVLADAPSPNDNNVESQQQQSHLSPSEKPKKPQEIPAAPTNPNTDNTITPQPNTNQAKAKQPANPPPSPPTVTHSYVTRLRARHEAEIAPIQFSTPVITTKQGKPAVIFKREDYMVKFADRCKFTVVGKFANTMPKMEVIRKSFIAQTKLRVGVKIAHFNVKTVYIDLDNTYDHSTIWSKRHMYIQGQMMRIEAWNPIFKPNEDSPIVPVWIIVPERPWHLYYIEILSPLLSPIGKALFLDLASFQKTRGSVVKVKIQIDLTKERPTHVWLGYDEDQDVNGDGQWLEIQYENLPSYCTNCRQLGHSMQACPVKLRDLEIQRKKQEEIVAATTSQTITQQKSADKAESSKYASYQSSSSTGEECRFWCSESTHSPPPHIPPDIGVAEGGKVNCQEEPIARQEGVPSGVGVPHVFHDCASAKMADHRLDSIPPATTAPGNASDQVSPTDEEFDVLSFEDDHLNQ
ncbi:hypothetical protein A4A49_43572 [Nicotiana attenuata]|uniref:DUF4283 domain-containing protein n=1 Tax=Nicotiana attenuata TaxID=49451 RepID=A0A1J6J5F6_NICAT|nr:hypothetical protein A4A49_43572 [Nicotiana attenuata]